jgi:hypothetical protein
MRQVANYNDYSNSYNNKTTTTVKICLLTRQNYGEGPIIFNLKTKQTRHNYSLSSRHLALGTKSGT